jgi:hypothetical protein
MIDLECKILALLAVRRRQFCEISSALGYAGAKSFRVADRALQRLRKAGQIAYARASRTWGLVPND